MSTGQPYSIRTDSQALELLTRRERLFVEYLTLTDAIEQINEKVYLVTCEIQGINQAFSAALERGRLSEPVLLSLRNALDSSEASA